MHRYNVGDSFFKIGSCAREDLVENIKIAPFITLLLLLLAIVPTLFPPDSETSFSLESSVSGREHADGCLNNARNPL